MEALVLRLCARRKIMQMQKDVHMSAKEMLYMLNLKPGDLAEYAIIPGTVERSQAVLKNLTNTVKKFSFFDYTMYNGDYEGIKITTGNGGRYAADSAICAEILCAAGTKNIIRAGSCGAMDEKIGIGDVVIVKDVIRGEGVTPYYVKEDFKTVADRTISDALVKACEALGVKYHLGTVWVTDAIMRETRELVEEKRANGAIAVDMVSSTMLTIPQLHNIKAGCILAVSDNLITGELGFINPKYYDAEASIIKICLAAVKSLAKK